jgi:ferredoxin
MRCQAVCPSEALTSPYTPEIPAQPTVQRNQVVFSCIRHKQANLEHVVVPCFGLFSPLTLMVLAMSGCRTVLFNIAPCSVCVNKGAAASFAAALDQVAPLSMELSGAALIATADPSDLVTDSNADRRAFLLNLGHSLSAFAGKKNPPESIEPASPPHTNRRIPRNTGLVMGMLQSVTGEKREKLRSLCTYQLTVSSACIPCPRCAGICPTGALRLERSDTGKQLLFNASQCSGCGLCAAFCTANALALTAPFLCAT